MSEASLHLPSFRLPLSLAFPFLPCGVSRERKRGGLIKEKREWRVGDSVKGEEWG